MNLQTKIKEYLDTVLPLEDDDLGALQEQCYKTKIPIIKKDTVYFLKVLLSGEKLHNVLEIGCAVGFSSSFFATFLSEHGKITTIDRFDVMIKQARENFENFGLTEKITLIENDASEVLPTLTEKYDLIFLDAAKGQYIKFLPYCVKLLKEGGLFIVDDIFQGGRIFMEREDVDKRQRTIYDNMKKFLKAVFEEKSFITTIVPVDDGVLFARKKFEDAIN